MELTLSQQVSLISPLIALSIGALIILLVDVFKKETVKPSAGLGVIEALTFATLTAALVLLHFQLPNYVNGQTVFSGLLYADQFSAFVTLLLTSGAVLAMMLGHQTLDQEGITAKGEYYSLFLMATVGAIIFASAAELITLFLGLEIMSMALYCLCGSVMGGSSVQVRRSTEAAMKYFLLGSFSSAFLLYGIALLYGLTGSTMLATIAERVVGSDPFVLLLALGLLLVGFAFKIGAVPFHFWAPDVYQGAPTSLTAYMACVIKAAAVVAALRALWTGFGGSAFLWIPAVWLISVLTMTLGNLIALRQRSVKRMLAYSSIAHAGYILTAFLAIGGEGSSMESLGHYGGAAAILYYLVVYTLMTMGAFGVVLALALRAKSTTVEVDDLSQFNGLGTRRPLLAALMALFMLSLAGIPPGLAGLLGKFYIFNAAIKAGFVGLAIIGVINSAISCYYYLRVIVAMYFVESDATEEPGPEVPGLSMAGALAVCAVGVVLLGMFPSLLYDGMAAVVAAL